MSSQSLEWSVLESIHPTICVSNEDAIVTLLVPVELGRDTPLRIVRVPHDMHLASPPTDAPSLSASSLPSNSTSPSNPCTPPTLPPIIQSFQATSAWLSLSTLTLIKQRMATMWSPCDDSGVLYTWVEWIRTGDFLADIGLLADDMHSIQIPHPSPQLLLHSLLAYASSSKSNDFAHASHLCVICLSERKGVRCLSLSCGHVFCRECLADMWELHVKEGQVSHVGCPEPKCQKADVDGADGLREATEDEVRAVLPQSALTRWRWLHRKRDLERDPTIIHCPMEYCQEPVPKPQSDTSRIDGSDEEDESGWARLRTCTVCGYSFCAFCRRTWHGPHTPCPFPVTSKFILDYLSVPSDSSNLRAIEQRYGRSNVLKLARQHKEEQDSSKWMDSHTMACPGCEIRVEKSMGCNHMTCVKCGTHFCYRCGTKIPRANPYQHFSTPHTSCFSKLFDFAPSAEDEGQPIEGAEFICSVLTDRLDDCKSSGDLIQNRWLHPRVYFRLNLAERRCGEV